MLGKHRREANIAKDKIGMEKMGPSLVPQVPPDVYCLPGKELSAGKRSQDEEQMNCLYPRCKKKGTKIKGSKLGREASPILKYSRLEPRGRDQSTKWKTHIYQQI